MRLITILILLVLLSAAVSAAFASCSDGIVNQGEDDVDCGGPCGTCPSCVDGLSNQNEILVDCGGPCRPCTWRDYLPVVLNWLGLGGLILLVLLFLWFAHSIVTSRMTFLFSHGKGIHFFYEDGVTYALIRFLNTFGKLFRHSDKDAMLHVGQAMNDLVAMRGLPEKTLRLKLNARLRELYGMITRLGPGFTFEALVEHIAQGDWPFSVKVIALRNTKLLYILEKTTYYPSVDLALDDILAALEELRAGF